MEPATLNGLMSMTEKELDLPEQARTLLSRDTIKIRVIDRGSLSAMFPIAPAEVINEPEKDLSQEERNKRYDARLNAWLRSAPEAERIAHRLGVERVKFHTIALASLEPKLTAAEAERLGNAADDIYIGILEFSGLAKKGDNA